ncbi:SgcJ/EcaC family oxidoreductase [Rubripirellula reticaptiva]|uniref:DUF4440 domain-containing protein n=1 Tax=Rubripirellula reticaptiva TaxID=2528013 RepID=A0A5C6F3D8_9BACT|nr:SgcJ/EcaC family oxidoreductase [Rubripirellula reticaptiva]TWU56323.1 hypothetical protein Poly59_26270 [Rubripirellula reticaptiva]
MKKLFAIYIASLIVFVPAAAAEPASGDMKAISNAVEGYVKDFNDGNVAGIASRWMENGQVTDSEGNVTKGRDKLSEQLSAYFAEVKDPKLSVDVKSIEMISPNVARETGVSTIFASEQVLERTDYVAVHVKIESGWKIDSIIESTHVDAAPSNYEHLKNLEWMIGTWSAGDEQSSITTTCRWSKNQNFIIRSFEVQDGAEDSFEGTQVVGWDPVNEAIRSWTFDSDGGYAAGRWKIEDGRYLESSKSILADGRVGSSTHIYQLGSDGSVSYQAIARQVDDELLPSVGPVTLNRGE